MGNIYKYGRSDMYMYVCCLENERLCLSESLSILLMSAVCLASYKIQIIKMLLNVHYVNFCLPILDCYNFTALSRVRSINFHTLSGIEDLCSRRDEVQRQVLEEEEEKRKIQNDIRILTERLAQVNESLAQKIATRSDYDHTIAETEAAYKKVCFKHKIMILT